MSDFSDLESRQLAEVIRQIICIMQVIDQRTVLPTTKPKANKTMCKPAARKVARPRAKTMVCPMPAQKKGVKKRKPAQKTRSLKTLSNACPMPGHSTGLPRPSFPYPGYTGSITRSMTAKARTGISPKKHVQLVRRRTVVKKPAKKSLAKNVCKQKVRRQSRKRPLVKKSIARMKCP